jgi:zinc D-Ala-D-Ala carboxypeptidase
MNLSPHFTLEELTISQTASRMHLDNTPPAEILERMRDVLCPGLEKVRALLGAPMHIDSGFRSAAVNRAVGGVGKSAHTLGYAADFIAPAYGSPLTICRALAAEAAVLDFDQLIEEGTWVHISFDPQARRQVLTKAAGGGYRAGLPAAA